jgi:hypothetical protein
MPLDPKPRRARGAKRPLRSRSQRPGAPKTPLTPPTGSAVEGPRPAGAELADRCLQTARSTWKAVAPHLRAAAELGARALAWMVRLLIRHRLTLFRMSHRVLWWAALAVMLVAGRALLSGTEVGPLVDDAHLYFAGGLALCLIVLVFAAERRMRMAAFMLGAGHGAFGLVTWLISQA